MGNSGAPKEISTDLPAPIVDALLNGYDIRITREVKDGLVMAKVIYEKYAGASRKVLCTHDAMKNLAAGKH